MTAKGIAPCLCAMLTLAALLAPSAAGDGVVMDLDTIDLVHEGDQTAIIHLSGGYQRMVLSIDVDRSSDSIWLFPVPADPDEIALEHMITGTRLFGNDMKGTSEMELEDDKRDIMDFQLASIIPGFRMAFLTFTYTGDSAGGIEVPKVHKVLDQGGVHSEVVTTADGGSLASYLMGKGKELPSVLEPKIDHYSSQGYSFIVSWINGSTDGKRPSIDLSFPRTELYYPMILTSAYGDIATPVELIVLHHVKVTNEGMGRIRHVYFNTGTFEDQWVDGNRLAGFLDLSNWTGRFTTVSIDAKASSYTEDLSFVHYSPDYSRDLGWDEGILLYLAVSAALSILFGIICSLIAFDKGSKERKVFGSLGVLNFLGIWVFLLGVLTASKAMRSTVQGKRVLAYALLFEGFYLLSIFAFVEYVLFNT